MVQGRSRIDEPEPRWQALLALIAAGATSLALPRWLSLGPRWLLPSIILFLLIPSVFAHRTGRHSLNHFLGIVINALLTCGLIGSVILLVIALPAQKEPLAFKRPRLRALVLETRWRRSQSAGSTRCRWQLQLCLSPDAGGEIGTAWIWDQKLETGICRLPLHRLYHEHDFWTD